MANKDIEAAAGGEVPAPQAPQKAYLLRSRSTEQGPPILLAELSQMESGLRNRNPTAPPSTVVAGDGAPETGEAATDLSDHGRPPLDAPRFASLVRTGSKGLQALITTGSWSTQSPDELKRHNEARGYDKLTYDRVDDFEEGYPQLAAFVDSNDTFANYRRFGRLSARLLLHLQNDLNNLEKKLDALDKQYAQDERMKYRLRGFEISDGRDDKCQKLCADIQKKYMEYADVLLKDASIRALGKAPRRNHMANFTWMQNEKALNEEKRDFLNHPDDFISISRHSGHRIEDFIQSWLDNRGPNFFIKRFLKTAEERRKTDSEDVDHYSKQRLAFLAILLQVVVVAVLFLTPVFVLFLVPTSRAVMAVTASVFVLAFTIVVSFMTEAKVQEVFFGTAAYFLSFSSSRHTKLTPGRYAAVIIMFLGNINQSGPVQAG
ncbi:hypothetical protein ACEPPN_014295 [Leptodophora sp. 'Broadleaf-Isolate-01']